MLSHVGIAQNPEMEPPRGIPIGKGKGGCALLGKEIKSSGD